jgi:hypothetical protein
MKRRRQQEEITFMELFDYILKGVIIFGFIYLFWFLVSVIYGFIFIEESRCCVDHIVGLIFWTRVHKWI